MKIIDLRSDTVTLPTPNMRRAMAEAELGDDVLQEDPTINRLEETAADRMGKEAALFVASGTMANLVCLLTHCGRGDEFIAGDQAHVIHYEGGGSAALGGIHHMAVKNNPDGTMNPDEIERAIRIQPNDHFPYTRLICLENTHNRCNGSPVGPGFMQAVREIADRHGLKMHLDGARIFNAAIALGMEAREIAGYFDSVSFCLSKGLSAPVGSMVCGTADFVDRARRNRKALGGGMRQAGVIAAAGIVALEEMVDRLAEDHENARVFAEMIAGIDGISVDLELVKTNLVFFNVVTGGVTADDLRVAMGEGGVLVYALDKYRIRAVMHHGIERADAEEAARVIGRVMESLRQQHK